MKSTPAQGLAATREFAVDAGRTIDVVITKGVRIDAPVTAKARPTSNLASAPRSPEERYLKGSNDEDY